MYGTDSALTTITRTLDKGLYLAKTKAVSNLSAVLCCLIGKRHNNIVKATVNMELTCSLNTDISFLRCYFLLFCHNKASIRLLSSLLLVCNSLLLSLTSTSIVLRALATYRKTITMTDTTIAANIHQALNVHLNL